MSKSKQSSTAPDENKFMVKIQDQMVRRAGWSDRKCHFPLAPNIFVNGRSMKQHHAADNCDMFVAADNCDISQQDRL